MLGPGPNKILSGVFKSVYIDKMILLYGATGKTTGNNELIFIHNLPRRKKLKNSILEDC
jgi:hypothetical protein